jgi:hypothetical protein
MKRGKTEIFLSHLLLLYERIVSDHDQIKGVYDVICSMRNMKLTR